MTEVDVTTAAGGGQEAAQALSGEPTDAQRKQALAAAVSREIGGGWNVQSQTDYQAVLVRPGTKVNHILHLILTILTLGVWLLVWIPLSIMRKREKHKVVTVDGFGNVTVVNR